MEEYLNKMIVDMFPTISDQGVGFANRKHSGKNINASTHHF
jgi:hypothetical protein